MALILSGIGCAVEIEHDRGSRLDPAPVSPWRRFPWRSPGRAPASALASLDLSTACAASRRLPGSGAISVRPPSAASTIRRNRLLSRTGARSAGGAPAAGWPVAASINRSGCSRMKTRLLSALNRSRPSCRAVMTGAASAIAAGDDLVDTLDRLIEAVGAEARQRILVWPGLRARRQDGEHTRYEHANREHERDEAIPEGKHSDCPGRARRPEVHGLGRLDSCYQRNATRLLHIDRYDAPPHFLVAVL